MTTITIAKFKKFICMFKVFKCANLLCPNVNLQNYNIILKR